MHFEQGSGVKQQATRVGQQAPLTTDQGYYRIQFKRRNMTVRKKLVKEIKKTNPDLADEIQYMSVKEFKALMEVFNVWCRL